MPFSPQHDIQNRHTRQHKKAVEPLPDPHYLYPTTVYLGIVAGQGYHAISFFKKILQIVTLGSLYQNTTTITNNFDLCLRVKRPHKTTSTVLDGRLSPPVFIAFTRYSNCGPRGWVIRIVWLSRAMPAWDHSPNSPPPSGCCRRSMT